MNKTGEKDWVVYIRAPIMPQGVEIIRNVSIDEVRETLDEIKERLPEWRATAVQINNTLRQIDKLSTE